MQNLPKILHLYWDMKPMSWLQVCTVTSFHSLNPDWRINVYIPKYFSKDPTRFIPDYKGKNYWAILEGLEYVNIEVVDMDTLGLADVPEIPRSDIFRYHILYTRGGIWSDFDVLWLKDMLYFFKNTTRYGKIEYPKSYSEGFVCMYHTTKGHHNIGILGSTKGNAFYEYLLTKCRQVLQQKKGTYSHQEFGVDLWNKEFPTLESLTDRFPAMYGVPYQTFYPYSIFNLKNLYRNTDLSPLNTSCVCLHWFNGHPLSKAYVNKEIKGICSMDEILRLTKTK